MFLDAKPRKLGAGARLRRGIAVASVSVEPFLTETFMNRPSAIACCSFLALFGVDLAGQEKTKDKKEERPSQTAVLAKNTVSRLGVAYGADDKQKLDVYSPRDAKGAPVVLFIHGGEWTKGDKADVSFKPKYFNENGVVFVSVNYRLTPAVVHPAHVSDIASAIRWVRDHAGEIGAAPDKLVLLGHSAGCHLATLTALDPRHLDKVKLTPRDLRGVVAWSGGMYDLVDRAKGEGNYPKYIRQAFGDTEAAWRDASPMAHVGDAPLPAFLFVSIEKGNASHQAAERMVELIRAKKGEADSQLLTGRTHFMANHLIGAPDDASGKVLLDFVQRVTR
jgi:acetyl esterase/lipase